MPDREDDLSPFADALRRLAPQPPEISRDALLFSAGKAAATSSWYRWIWPTSTAVFACSTLVFGAFLISPAPVPAPEVRYVVLPQPTPEEAPPPSTPESIPVAEPARDESYVSFRQALRTRREVMRWGADAIPRSGGGNGGINNGPDVTAREVGRWLELPTGTFALPPVPPKPAPKNEDDGEDNR